MIATATACGGAAAHKRIFVFCHFVRLRAAVIAADVADIVALANWLNAGKSQSGISICRFVAHLIRIRTRVRAAHAYLFESVLLPFAI